MKKKKMKRKHLLMLLLHFPELGVSLPSRSELVREY